MTEHRKAQQALEEAREALFQSQKMEAVGQLTGGVAHDFNNMLAGIIGAMELLRRRIRSGRYAETDKYIDAAVASANRAAALTARLLAFGRRQSLDVKPVNINSVVTSMVDLLGRTMGEDIGLETRLRPDLWPAMTDANQVENALLNLAINARDAMPEGGKLTITTDGVALDRADAARRRSGGGTMSSLRSAIPGKAWRRRYWPAPSSPSTRPSRSARGPAWACR